MSTCKCVGKHIPKNMNVFEYHLFDDDGPSVWLCATTLDNTMKLWKLYEEYNGRPPWEILKEYSEYVRHVVEKGRELRRARATGQPSLFNLD